MYRHTERLHGRLAANVITETYLDGKGVSLPYRKSDLKYDIYHGYMELSAQQLAEIDLRPCALYFGVTAEGQQFHAQLPGSKGLLDWHQARQDWQLFKTEVAAASTHAHALCRHLCMHACMQSRATNGPVTYGKNGIVLHTIIRS